MAGRIRTLRFLHGPLHMERIIAKRERPPPDRAYQSSAADGTTYVSSGQAPAPSSTTASKDVDGAQDSTFSVFTQDPDGTVRHSYSEHPRMNADRQERGIDLFAPVWHYLDLTPQGRGNWSAPLGRQGAHPHALAEAA